MLVVHGAVGSGKTRLAKQLSASPEITSLLVPAYVRCAPGDVAAALRARAERALDALPGALEQTLRDDPRLLIIDDAHNLAQDEAARLLAELTREVGAGRLLLLSREVLPLRRNDSQRFEMTLEGLDEGAARELWAQLEETYGPTQAGACDDALTRTRGMPLAMRREYARYTAGDGAWELGELSEDARAWQVGVDQLAAEDSEVAEYVQTLEEARDTAELPEASGEAIAREFERYLRRRDVSPPGGHATADGGDSGSYRRDNPSGRTRPPKPPLPGGEDEDTSED